MKTRDELAKEMWLTIIEFHASFPVGHPWRREPLDPDVWERETEEFRDAFRALADTAIRNGACAT